MFYFLAEDEYYYTEKGRQEIQANYPEVENLVEWPDFQEIKKIANQSSSDTAFLAPYGPNRIEGVNFSDTLFFEEISLPNRYGILTTGQHNAKKTKAEVLEKRLGVEFIESNMNMSNYGGAAKLHEQVEIIRQKFRHKESTKGFLITGVPGTGKSFFAKCLAGELGYLLVSLNLSIFMEKQDTVQAINDFFKFFQYTPGKYIIWIDEIEKMFTGEKSQQVIGALLTNINEATNLSDDTAFFIVATANNVSGIAETNPEFFRNGRFDAVIFLMNPDEKDAENIFTLYINIQKKRLRNSLIPMAIKNFLIDNNNKTTTRSEEMAKIICADLTEDDKKEILNKKDTPSIEYIVSHKRIVTKIHKLANEIDFSFNKDRFMREATQKYRTGNSQIGRFIYTPAEIEFIIKDTFHAYYLLPKAEFAYDKMLDRYQPLQSSIKDGVREIIAKASNFMEI